jgi:hypothetical protein
VTNDVVSPVDPTAPSAVEVEEGATRADAAELLQRFLPVLRFNEGEYFLPMSVDDYLPQCQLWKREGRRRHRLRADVGELDRDRLAEITGGSADGWSLQYVTEPMKRHDVVGWRLDPDRPRFRGGSRLGSVGVFGRFIDAGMRFTLLLRGSVASGSEAAAEVAARPFRTAGEHVCYGRAFDQAGYIVVQYWFFYPFNDWRSRAHGVNDHEADWEQVTVFAAEEPDGRIEPRWVVFSAHDEVGDDLRRRWDDPDLTLVGEHPVVFAGLGSHSGAYLSGDYLLTVDRNALGHLYTVGRRIARVLLPWARETDSGAVGAPYIDYARGDGEVVGVGGRTLRCELIDDTTVWVHGYRGLWGRDTEDPFGGERGPAGPRYERSGMVRASWRDPVGWSGLGKVPPTEQAAAEIRRRRAEQLDEELRTLAAERAAQLDVARSAHLLGEPAVALEATLAETTRQLDQRRDERRELERPTPAATPGPHDHLRHRRLPMAEDSTARHRVLMVWSAISTPLVLIAVTLAVLPLGPSVTLLAGISLFIIFAIEATARRRLFSYVVTLVVVVAALIALGFVVVGLLSAWRFTVAALLLTAAVLVAVLNLSELRRQ